MNISDESKIRNDRFQIQNFKEEEEDKEMETTISDDKFLEFLEKEQDQERLSPCEMLAENGKVTETPCAVKFC